MGYIGNSNPSVTSLGGDIDVNGHQIKSSNNGNIQIIPDGSGTVTVDVLTFPVADGTNGQVLQTNGSGVLSFTTISNGITVQDEGSALSTAGTTLNFTGSGVTASGTGATKTINIAGNSYGNSDVDSHLNQSNPTSGYVLSWNGSDYAWVSNAGYTDSDVNTHLNQSSASSGQILSWNGSDYAWVADQTGGGGLSGSVVTITAASAPSSPGSGEAKIYSTNSSGQTGILVHSGNTSEVFQVKYHTTSTPVMAINNQGNTDIYGYVAAAYYDKRSGMTGGNFQPAAGYGEGSGLELPGAIIMTGSSTYSQYGKPIKMYGGSNSYISVRASTSMASATNFDFILPPSVGSSGQYLKTTGSGVTEWAAVSGGGGASDLDGLSDCFHDGFGCISIGYQTMTAANDDGTDESTSNRNIAFGYRALQNHTGGSSYDQIAIGMNALKSKINSGQGNVCVGKETGPTLVGGYINVFLGYYAGYGASSAGYNIGVGYGALQNLTSGTNNIAIGKHAGKSTSPSGAISSGSNSICLGNNSISNLYCADTTISSSDARDKTDISDFSPGLSFIKKLRPVTYRWDKRSWYIEDDSDDVMSQKPDGTYKKQKQHAGFLAQEVLAIEKEFGWATGKDDMLFCNLNEDETSYGLKYERLVPVLVNAIKELSSEVDTLKAKVG